MSTYKDQQITYSPCIPDSCYNDLPLLLQACTSHFDDTRERDLVLLSSLTLLSSCYSNAKGWFDNGWIGPNLFTFIVAPPASGKGIIRHVQRLGEGIHKEMVDNNAKRKKIYEGELKAWQQMSRSSKISCVPPALLNYPLFFIPGNTSAAAINMRLSDSQGTGLIFETEADTLSGALKQDWGNFSDTLRKAFHHELISMERRSEGQYCYISEPSLSILLSGTPSQVPKLISSSENGLFSRFIFYTYSRELIWKESSEFEFDYSGHFKELGNEFVKEFKQKVDKSNYSFYLTSQQRIVMTGFFKEKLNELKKWEGENVASSLYRLSTISFRIAMILALTRHLEEGENGIKVNCQDKDFITALTLSDILFEHALIMYGMLPQHTLMDDNPRMRQFYNQLPVGIEIQRKQAVQLGKGLGICERSIGNYLDQLFKRDLLSQPRYGIYFRKE